jgi:SpoVK/Ycf46/Vps4 family AAA+-type ATPase
LCIDELDGLFRERQADQHEVMGELLTEFLQWMDGMMTKDDSSPPIILIGATNRPFDVDPAILRRLPHAHCVGLPDAATRSTWFQSALQEIPHTISAEQRDALISATDGYTYSDLRTWLQAAVLAGPLKRCSKQPEQLTYDDLLAVRTAPTSGGSARYQERLAQFQSKHPATGNSRESPQPHPEELVWKTVLGNYYNLGTLQVDGPTMDLLQQIAQELKNFRDEEEED